MKRLFLIACLLTSINGLAKNKQALADTNMVAEFFEQRFKDAAKGIIIANSYLPIIMIGNKLCGDAALLGISHQRGATALTKVLFQETYSAAIIGGTGGVALMPVARVTETLAGLAGLNTEYIPSIIGVILGYMFHKYTFDLYSNGYRGRASREKHMAVNVLLPAILLPALRSAMSWF